eukprot:3663672-Prymnesium_polylepis.1
MSPTQDHTSAHRSAPPCHLVDTARRVLRSAHVTRVSRPVACASLGARDESHTARGACFARRTRRESHG